MTEREIAEIKMLALLEVLSAEGSDEQRQAAAKHVLAWDGSDPDQAQPGDANGRQPPRDQVPVAR